MTGSQIIAVIQIILSALLVTAILLQQRDGSMGGAFGGGGTSYFAKRGLEKILFITTIILAVIFVGLAIANLLII
jgi:protein translocase SecG subunit